MRSERTLVWLRQHVPPINDVMRDGLQRPISKPAPGPAARSALLGSILTGAHLRAQIAAQGSSRTLTRVTAPIVPMASMLSEEVTSASPVPRAGKHREGTKTAGTVALARTVQRSQKAALRARADGILVL
jgi:hypothetical protein